MWTEWKPTWTLRALVVFAGLFGVLLMIDRPVGRTILVLQAINTLVIAATWSVGGRFLVPLFALWCVAAGIGLWAIAVAVTERRQQVREILDILP